MDCCKNFKIFKSVSIKVNVLVINISEKNKKSNLTYIMKCSWSKNISTKTENYRHNTIKLFENFEFFVFVELSTTIFP